MNDWTGEIIESGELGEVQSISMLYGSEVEMSEGRWSWRRSVLPVAFTSRDA